MGLICALFIFHFNACVKFLKKSKGWYRCAHIAALGTFVAILPNFAIGMVMAQQRGLFLIAFMILIPYIIQFAELGGSISTVSNKKNKDRQTAVNQQRSQNNSILPKAAQR